MWPLIAAGIWVSLGASGLRAQFTDVSAYYFHLGSGSGDSPLGDAGVADFQRLRLMWQPDVGPLALNVAYEHTLLLNSTDVVGAGMGILAPEAGGNRLTLDWTVDDGDHFTWRHRFDRLGLTLPLGGSTELSVGRQVVSWASTLILTPADPFTPFDPADPFREYRAGVDAVRFRAYPGPFTEIDLVVRPVTTTDGDQITALARGKTNWLGWDFGAWGGVVFDEPAGALSLVGALGPWAVRSEVAVRSEADEVIVRGTVGVDRRFSVRGTGSLPDRRVSARRFRGRKLGRSTRRRGVGSVPAGRASGSRPGRACYSRVLPDPPAVGHRPSVHHESGGRERPRVGWSELVDRIRLESSGRVLPWLRRRYPGSHYRDRVGVRGPAARGVRFASHFF